MNHKIYLLYALLIINSIFVLASAPAQVEFNEIVEKECARYLPELNCRLNKSNCDIGFLSQQDCLASIQTFEVMDVNLEYYVAEYPGFERTCKKVNFNHSKFENRADCEANANEAEKPFCRQIRYYAPTFTNEAECIEYARSKYSNAIYIKKCTFYTPYDNNYLPFGEINKGSHKVVSKNDKNSCVEFTQELKLKEECQEYAHNRQGNIMPLGNDLYTNLKDCNDIAGITCSGYEVVDRTCVKVDPLRCSGSVTYNTFEQCNEQLVSKVKKTWQLTAPGFGPPYCNEGEKFNGPAACDVISSQNLSGVDCTENDEGQVVNTGREDLNFICSEDKVAYQVQSINDEGKDYVDRAEKETNNLFGELIDLIPLKDPTHRFYVFVLIVVFAVYKITKK